MICKNKPKRVRLSNHIIEVVFGKVYFVVEETWAQISWLLIHHTHIYHDPGKQYFYLELPLTSNSVFKRAKRMFQNASVLQKEGPKSLTWCQALCLKLIFIIKLVRIFAVIYPLPVTAIAFLRRLWGFTHPQSTPKSPHRLCQECLSLVFNQFSTHIQCYLRDYFKGMKFMSTF